MSCKFSSTIECVNQVCDKCGWNPSVSEKRKKKIRSRENDFLNLGDRLRSYKAAVIDSCYKVLAGKIGGKVTGEDLQLLSMRAQTKLNAEDLKRIDAVLRRFEGENDGS